LAGVRQPGAIGRYNPRAPLIQRLHMRIRPRLFDWDNLHGPQWIVPELSEDEVGELYEATVMFIGYDRSKPDQTVVLGSGFIVGVADTLIVATASHIFTWWTDCLQPPAPHGLRGLEGERADLMRRLQKVVQDGAIAACVTPRGERSGMILSIVGLAINSNPRDLDVGFVQLGLSPSVRAKDFRVLPIDADAFSFRDPVLMAGYIGGGRRLSNEEQHFGAGLYEQRLAVRAGRVGELANQADGHRSAMYRVNIPSLAGMSGGPLIVLRETDNGALSLVTAVGVISSSRLGTPVLLNHCEEGETWVSPIVLGLGRKVSIHGNPTTISDAIHNGTITAYGSRARKFEFLREETSDTAFVSFRERARPESSD
jgi:hypothetical protein